MIISLAVGFIIAYIVWKIIYARGAEDIPANDKAILVTGAASGIGKAVVHHLLSKGCFVYALDRDDHQLDQHYKDKKNIKTMKVDVTSQEDVTKAFEMVVQQGRGLYGVVNSAGILVPPTNRKNAFRCGAEQDIDKEIRPLFEVNVFGTMRVNQVFLPLILRSKGVIVNIASVAGRVSAPSLSSYSATKHSVIGYTSCIRKELASLGVRVVCIEPGIVATPLIDGALGVEFDWSNTCCQDRGFQSKMDLVARIANRSAVQQPEAVAARIVNAVFSSSVPLPHIVVDLPLNTVFHHLLSCLPHAWVDKILA